MELRIPTLYNEAIHGKMTDEERRQYNLELMHSVPERNIDDMSDGVTYRLKMATGQEKEAEPYKAGAMRDAEWVRLRNDHYDRMLYTAEEIEQLKKTDKELRKEDREIFRKAGLSKKFVDGITRLTSM